MIFKLCLPFTLTLLITQTVFAQTYNINRQPQVSPKHASTSTSKISNRVQFAEHALQQFDEKNPFYFSAFLGSSWMSLKDFDNSFAPFGTGQMSSNKENSQKYNLSASFGYNLHSLNVPLRTELSFSYRPEVNFNQTIRYQSGGNSLSISNAATVDSYDLMANVIYDYPLTVRLKPFVGAGIGFSYNKTSGKIREIGGTGALDTRDSQKKFAWNLLAGAEFRISPRLSLEGMYKYADLGDLSWSGSDQNVTFNMKAKNFNNHQLMFGFKYRF